MCPRINPFTEIVCVILPDNFGKFRLVNQTSHLHKETYPGHIRLQTDFMLLSHSTKVVL